MIRTAPPSNARPGDDDPATALSGRDVRIGRDQVTAALVEAALQREEGLLSVDGSLVVDTGEYTGRSPRDKYLVRDPGFDADLWWGDGANSPMEPAAFDRLQSDVAAFLQGRDRFVQHLSAIAAPARSVPVTVVTDHAWAALFSQLLLLPERPAPDVTAGWTILHAPQFRADPARHGTRGPTVIALALARRQIVIAGTEYAGEIKKSVFSALQYALPMAGVLTMHCSANMGNAGDVALFFGLSGTGKTSLSIDGSRRLIGDDEHGWDDDGIFNLEGGCYAKVIDLSADAEPEIYRATRRFGTLLENVAIDPVTREPDFRDGTKTENSRAAFPIEALGNVADGVGGHPRHILLLTADAFGVLPPVARLTDPQALYWFLSGYTAKLAGTERGMTQPEATFSACFGAPFLPLRPARYAALLGERLRTHRPEVWLVNTGWTGGPAGVGRRMPIALTRAIVRSILNGSLATVPTRTDPRWGFAVPRRVPDAPDAPLDPRATWTDPAAFDVAEWRLAADVIANFEQFAADVPPEVLAAGPRLPAAP